MGSVIGIDKCPRCGGLLHNEYWYKTGEERNFCERCGYKRFCVIKRDKARKWVQEDVEYHINGSIVLGINLKGKLVWEKPISFDISEEDICMFLNAYSFNRKKNEPDWVKPLVDLDGHKNIYFKKSNGEIKQLTFRGNWFRFQVNKDGKKCFVIQKAVWDIGEIDGNGIICVIEPNGCSSYYTVGEKTKAEVVSMWNDIKKEPVISDASFVTFRSLPIGELECLFGEMPISYDEYIKESDSEEELKQIP